MKMKRASMVSEHSDRVSAVVLASIGAFLIYSASPLPIGRLNAPDAGFFPIILATILIILSTILFVRSFQIASPPLEVTRQSWAVVFGAAGLLLYAALLERVGFLICTAAALILLMKAYGGLTWRICFLVATPVVLAVYFGFLKLGVPLPRGIFGLS